MHVNLAALLILVAAALVRAPYVLWPDLYYNSDTAITDLMTLHFLEGQFSLYYWGERYYGVLDQLALMPLFSFLGPYPWVSRLVPFSLWLLLVGLFHELLLKSGERGTAHLAAFLLAISPPICAQITFSTYNYAFVGVLGALHLLAAHRLVQGPRTPGRMFGAGLLAGVSLYYFRLILVFWLAIGVAYRWWGSALGARPEPRPRLGAAFLLRKVLLLEDSSLPRGLKRVLVLVNLGNGLNFLLAVFLWFHGDLKAYLGNTRISVPFWPTLKTSLLLGALVAAIHHTGKIHELMRELWKRPSARAGAVGFLLGYAPALLGSFWGRSPSSPGGLVPLPVLVNNLAVVWGEFARGTVSGDSGVPALVLAATVIALSGVAFLLRRFWLDLSGVSGSPPAGSASAALAAVGLVMGLTCVRTEDAPGIRFLLPFLLCVPIGIAWSLEAISARSRWVAWALAVVVGANSLLAHARTWRDRPPADKYARLAQRLVETGIAGGYADYWVAYHVTFLSGRRVLLVPAAGIDRYPPYTAQVQALEHPVWIGEPPRVKHVVVRGQRYRVEAQETWDGISVARLKRRVAGQ